MRHSPKQGAQHICSEQQRDEAGTQSGRAGSRSQSHDYASFCDGGGGDGDDGGSDCGVDDDLSLYKSSIGSYALVDVGLKDTLE